MRNWRTTFVGAALAGLSFLAIYQSNGGDLANWQQWLIPVAIAALGFVAKDAGVTGAVKLAVLSLFLLPLASCAPFAAFLVANEPMIEAGAVGLVRAGVKSGTAKFAKTSAKNPVKVQ